MIAVFEYFRDRHHFENKRGKTPEQEILKTINLGLFLSVCRVWYCSNSEQHVTFVVFNCGVLFCFLFLLPSPSVILPLCEFGACCIAIFMHGFTAKGSLIHFSRPHPLLRVSVSAYSMCAAPWRPCQLAPGFNCIEVIYMQDEYCICILILPKLEAALQVSSFRWPEFLLRLLLRHYLSHLMQL